MTTSHVRFEARPSAAALVTSPLRSAADGLWQVLRGVIVGSADAAAAVRSPFAQTVPAVDVADLRVLVTGCNCGLGRALVVRLARAGARRIVMACRDEVPQALGDVRRQAGPAADLVDMAIDRVDLADLASVHALCDALRDRHERLDVVVLNAGIVTAQARRSAQGLDTMFQVNYLANVVLVNRLLADGVLPMLDKGQQKQQRGPRIVIVSSEDHRHPVRIDFGTFGVFRDYYTALDMSMYGESKLYLTAFMWELSRRLNEGCSGDDPRLSVFGLCPGPVNSNIAAEAPFWTKPFVRLMFWLLFRDPDDAARPLFFLTAAQEALRGRTEVYVHRFTEKQPQQFVDDPAFGAALWYATESLLDQIDSHKPRAPMPLAGPAKLNM